MYKGCNNDFILMTINFCENEILMQRSGARTIKCENPLAYLEKFWTCRYLNLNILYAVINTVQTQITSSICELKYASLSFYYAKTSKGHQSETAQVLTNN